MGPTRAMKMVAAFHLAFVVFWAACVAAGTWMAKRRVFDLKMEGRDVTAIESLNMPEGGPEMVLEALYFFSASFGFAMAIPMLLGLIVLLFPHRAGIAMLVGVAILHLVTTNLLLLIPILYLLFQTETQEVYAAASWRPSMGFLAGIFGLIFATLGLLFWLKLQIGQIVTTDEERCLVIAQEIVPGVQKTPFEPLFSFRLPGIDSVLLLDEEQSLLFLLESPMNVAKNNNWTEIAKEANLSFPWGNRELATQKEREEDGWVFATLLKRDENVILFLLWGQSEDPEDYRESLKELEPKGEALLNKL